MYLCIMEILMIKIDCSEWDYIWTKLSEHPVNEGLENPREALNEGESWQYMLSYKQGNKILHELRHKKHPVTQNLYKMVLHASNDFNENDIEVYKKIK